MFQLGARWRSWGNEAGWEAENFERNEAFKSKDFAFGLAHLPWSHCAFLSSSECRKRSSESDTTQVQFKARQIYATGYIFMREAHKGWLSQRSAKESGMWAAERASGRLTVQALKDLSCLSHDVRQLPELGFPSLSGFHSMPSELFREANNLADEFLKLIVHSMANLAWDSQFWTQLWPNAFAVLLEEDNAEANLKFLQDTWATVHMMEGRLFPTAPQKSREVVRMLAEQGRQSPELSRFYFFLDGITHQLTREAIALLEKHEWKPDVLGDPLFSRLLSDAFCVPLSTKSWNEDVFRDLRLKFKNVPASVVTSWSRQKGCLESLMGRSKEKIMPFYAEPSHEALKALHAFRHKKLITNAIFSPPTNPSKAKRAAEYGMPFDVGFRLEEAKPLISLEPLATPDKHMSEEDFSADVDGMSMMLLPASKVAGYSSAAAWASVGLMRRFIEDGQWAELEQALALRWQGNLLRVCEIYEFGGKNFVSLGYHGYAVLCHEVFSFSHNSATYFSFKDIFILIFLGGSMRKHFYWLPSPGCRNIIQDVTGNGLFWQSCHELLDPSKCKGYLTEIVVSLGSTVFWAQKNLAIG